MEVKDFSSGDLDTFSRLCEMFYSSGATKRPFCREIAEKTFKRILDKHENLWGKLFIDSDGRAVGYALITSYWCNEDGGTVIILDEIFVDPAERNKGYGSVFMKWAEAYYKNDAVAISLYVVKDNDSAHRLYAKNGYVYGGFEQMIKYI